MKLTEVLKAMREGRELTYTGLRKATDGRLHPTRAKSVEEGKTSISIALLCEIADKLGYDIDCKIKKK